MFANNSIREACIGLGIIITKIQQPNDTERPISRPIQLLQECSIHTFVSPDRLDQLVNYDA